MILDILNRVIYYFKLTFTTEVLWVVLPLAIATVAIIVYFERYKEERPGWNTHFANSLVLLFISIILLRHVHAIDNLGMINYVNYPLKTVVSASLLLLGAIILFLNFEHYLPEKMARQVSSPLTLNMVAYIAIIFVYSGTEGRAVMLFSPGSESGWVTFFSLLILFFVLLSVLNVIRHLLGRLFKYLKKLKDKEKKEVIVEDKKEIDEKKKELNKEEKIIKTAKKEVNKKEKYVKRKKLKELDKQKKEAIKLKKIVEKKIVRKGK